MNFGTCPTCEYPLDIITLVDGEDVLFCFDCKTIIETVED